MQLIFPRAQMGDTPYDFSFSGVKSAVLNYLNGCQMKGMRPGIRRMLPLLSRKLLQMYW